jgi:hypothetical protein
MLPDDGSSMLVWGTAECGSAECGTAEGSTTVWPGHTSTPGMPPIKRNPSFSLAPNTYIALLATVVDTKSDKCARRSKGVEKGPVRVSKCTGRHPAFPRSGLSSAEPRERKRTKRIKGEGIGNSSRVETEGGEIGIGDGERIREIGIGDAGGEWEAGGDDDRSQLKGEEGVHETMSSRDSEGEMHSMDSGFESALNSQKSFTDSDTGDRLVSTLTCGAGSAVPSSARLSDNSENKRGSFEDCVESGKTGTIDSQQNNRALEKMRKEVRSAVRRSVDAVERTGDKGERLSSGQDAVERLSSNRATGSSPTSKRLSRALPPVYCSTQASGVMSKLLSGLFKDLNEGRKSLKERAAKRDFEVTQSILEDIARLNCGRGRDTAEDGFLVGARSPSKVSPSDEVPLECDPEYITWEREKDGSRSGAHAVTEAEEEDSCPLTYPLLHLSQTSPVYSTLTSVVQRRVKGRGANIWHHETNVSHHTLIPRCATQNQARTMNIKMKLCDVAQLTASPPSPGGQDMGQGQVSKGSGDVSADGVTSDKWEEAR